MINIENYRDDARELVAKLYKDDAGNPIVLTDGQCDLFNLIFKKLYPRVHIEAFTRYGKSLTIALAVLTRVAIYPELFSIVAGTDDQARIIMSYIIQHIFDNDLTKSRFIIGKGETAENIRRHRSKDRINFLVGEENKKQLLGEVYITNAKGALGHGAPNVVCFPDFIKIKTNKGNIEIGKIVNEKINVKILTYNHEKKQIEYKNILEYQKNLLGDRDLIEIDLGDRKIVCTEDHPVWVDNKGYVKAKDLIAGDICKVLD